MNSDLNARWIQNAGVDGNIRSMCTGIGVRVSMCFKNRKKASFSRKPLGVSDIRSDTETGFEFCSKYNRTPQKGSQQKRYTI